MKGTTGSLRVSTEAYAIARERSKNECISMCQWISKAILEKALLDDLVEEKNEENQ